MNFPRWTALCGLMLLASGMCTAQQRFPLRAGEWEAKMSADNTPASSITMKYCLNDDLWAKAMSQNPSCTVQQLQVTPSGASYTLDCPAKAFQMKGKVEMTFDGMEHMTAKGAFDITVSGKTTSSVSHVDYRWKAAACSPDDANLKHRQQ